jgi:hypothetical protein
MVSPRRAGQAPGGNDAFLGLLPPPRNGECDITDMFPAKLREWLRLRSAVYHVPLAGSRICIRSWPQDNGWEGKEMSCALSTSSLTLLLYNVPSSGYWLMRL